MAAAPAGAFHRRPAAMTAVDRQIPAGAVHVRIGPPLRVHVERGKPTFRFVDVAFQRRGVVGERSERVRGPGERFHVGRVDAVEPTRNTNMRLSVPCQRRVRTCRSISSLRRSRSM